MERRSKRPDVRLSPEWKGARGWMVTAAIFLMGLALPLFSQPAAIQSGNVEFEVASFKMDSGSGASGLVRTDQRFEMHKTSLYTLILMAYELYGYQLTVPNWMRDQPYSVVATLPSGAKKEQIPAMLKRLLADRLALSLHVEMRATDVLALTVDKAGSKLSPCTPPEKELPLSFDPAPKRQTPEAGICPSNRAVFRPGSSITIEANTMEYLVRYLLDAVDRPLVDRTDLKGNYNIYLLGAPLQLCGPRERCAPPNPDTPPLTEALKQLGLRLEGRREKIEHWVVDSANRVPTEE